VLTLTVLGVGTLAPPFRVAAHPTRRTSRGSWWSQMFLMGPALIGHRSIPSHAGIILLTAVSVRRVRVVVVYIKRGARANSPDALSMGASPQPRRVIGAGP